MELIVYTLCVIGFLIIIGLSHFVRSYRKRSSINIPRENVGERVEMRQEIVEHSYIEIYDEIDENLMGEDIRDTVVKPPFRNTNATVSNARIDKTTSSHDDTSSYLDPCFTVEETDNESSSKESSSSHSSNCHLVIPDHTGYLYPNQPLRERQLISDGYEVTVHVHKTSESSSGSESSEEMSSCYKYSHVYQRLQQDQSSNKHEYEQAIKTANEMDIDLKAKNDIQDCINKVFTDDKDNDPIYLLNKYEKDDSEVNNDKEQLNAHLFFGQTIGDACREVSEKTPN
ncbi:Hypothetical predicted protein [Mytilus galloprovincialis]|uniref:Uncharacterized protein n=1 Tax=Mytilus galloprovincialis TaxID=29158 RepID=A0A8B6E8J8_MYTGA|nr:Hypothetical predicted protein [Mytilus galloprovincialis]